MTLSKPDVFQLKATPKEERSRLHLYFSELGSGSVIPIKNDEKSPKKDCKDTSCKKDFQKTAMLMGFLPGLTGFFDMGDLNFSTDELFSIMGKASDNLEADINLNTSSLEWQKTLVAYNEDGSYMTRDQLDHSNIDQSCIAVTTHEDLVSQQNELSRIYAIKSELDQTHLDLKNGEEVNLEALSDPVQTLLREQKTGVPEQEEAIAFNPAPVKQPIFNN